MYYLENRVVTKDRAGRPLKLEDQYRSSIVINDKSSTPLQGRACYPFKETARKMAKTGKYTMIEICNQLNLTYTMTMRFCRGIRCRREKDVDYEKLIGKKIGLLTILGHDPDNEGNNKLRCRCDCGKTFYARTSNVTLRLQNSCGEKTCKKQFIRYQRQINPNYGCSRSVYQNFGWLVNSPNISKFYEGKDKGKGQTYLMENRWNGIRNSNRNRSRNVAFSVTKEYAEKLFRQQDSKCSISGLPLLLNPIALNKITTPCTASIDRIDSSQGYVVGNVQWVHKVLNRMKLAYEHDYFIYWALQISAFQKDKENILNLTAYCPYIPTNRTTYKGLLSQAKLNKIVKKAVSKNIGFDPDLTRKYLTDLFIQQKGICALSGIPIKLRPRKEITASLDRIDSLKKYSKDNVQWVHKDVNMIKSILSQDVFFKICSIIASKHIDKWKFLNQKYGPCEISKYESLWD